MASDIPQAQLHLSEGSQVVTQLSTAQLGMYSINQDADDTEVLLTCRKLIKHHGLIDTGELYRFLWFQIGKEGRMVISRPNSYHYLLVYLIDTLVSRITECPNVKQGTYPIGDGNWIRQMFYFVED